MAILDLRFIKKLQDLIDALDAKHSKINEVYCCGAVEGYSKEYLRSTSTWSKKTQLFPGFSTSSLTLNHLTTFLFWYKLPRQEDKLMVIYKDAMKTY